MSSYKHNSCSAKLLLPTAASAITPVIHFSNLHLPSKHKTNYTLTFKHLALNMSSAMANYKLFTSLKLSDSLELKNRIVYGPTTRARSDPISHVPLERNIQYYEQRASAGLIITEGTAVSEQAFGWYGTPAMYTDEQEAGWKKLVDRVHTKGAKIFLQLWHMGRQSHPSFHPSNEVVSASATQYVEGRTRNVHGEHVSFEKARALETNEIPAVVDMFRQSAIRAKRAGFDGVELLANNGYLIDQFLQSSTNQRTDKYGGSFESRYRFLDEIVDALKTVFPADRIAVRLSPNGVFGGMSSDDNTETFMYAFEQLSEHGLAYLAILDGFGFGRYENMTRPLTVFDAKKAFNGYVMANNSYTQDTAEGVVSSGAADLVSFVRLRMKMWLWGGVRYLSNPDLVERFQNDWPLDPVIDAEYFWDASKGDECYHTFKPYQPTNGKTEHR